MHELNLFENCKTIQFDSLSDIGNYIEKRKNARNWSSVRKSASSFNNYTDFDEAVKQMLFGYKFDERLIEGLNDFRDSETLDTGGLSMDVEGSVYDMGAVVQGVPECCISDTRIEGKKHLRLVCSVGFNCGSDSEHILNRSIAIANLIGTLLIKGYVVDLDFLMMYDAYSAGKALFFVKIPNGSFCASTIAFLNSPQFLRTICVAVSDFILDKDIDGEANCRKSEEILQWCRNNSLYFPDWYDGYDDMEELYGTVEKAEKTINSIYEKWVKSKEK